MNNIIRIGIVGAPQSGKTSLIEYLRKILKDVYQVMIADEPPTVVLRAGIDPEYNSNPLDFQVFCLNEYINVYDRIDRYLPTCESMDKPIVILYDTLPTIGQCYLPGNVQALEAWSKVYGTHEKYFNMHKPDVIFNTELLQGEYSPKGNVVRRELNTEYILGIEESINNLYPDAIKLSNTLSIEERASVVMDYIEEFFKPKYTTITHSNVRVSVSQNCYYCDWHETRDINDLYHYCPKCGKLLPIFKPSSTSGGSLDPLGIEARNKMFYVDPEKLPFYNSGV